MGLEGGGQLEVGDFDGDLEIYGLEDIRLAVSHCCQIDVSCLKHIEQPPHRHLLHFIELPSHPKAGDHSPLDFPHFRTHLDSLLFRFFTIFIEDRNRQEQSLSS